MDPRSPAGVKGSPGQVLTLPMRSKGKVAERMERVGRRVKRNREWPRGEAKVVSP